jgi:hypothetical protein
VRANKFVDNEAPMQESNLSSQQLIYLQSKKELKIMLSGLLGSLKEPQIDNIRKRMLHSVTLDEFVEILYDQFSSIVISNESKKMHPKQIYKQIFIKGCIFLFNEIDADRIGMIDWKAFSTYLLGRIQLSEEYKASSFQEYTSESHLFGKKHSNPIDKIMYIQSRDQLAVIVSTLSPIFYIGNYDIHIYMMQEHRCSDIRLYQASSLNVVAVLKEFKGYPAAIEVT